VEFISRGLSSFWYSYHFSIAPKRYITNLSNYIFSNRTAIKKFKSCQDTIITK
jgi:hypothetical protein